MFNFLIWNLKKVVHKLSKFEKANEVLPYRKYLFQELLKHNNKDYFEDKRILEIGPRDGDDTFRLEKLNPKEIVIIDLPDKTEQNLKWLKQLKVNYDFIEANFMYMTNEDIENLGKFDLIYFTGVLYHNPEQLRFLYKLFNRLNNEGSLVLESATTRNWLYRNRNVVEIYHPVTYRNTTTVTHLPSKKAIKSWLQMVGFEQIYDSNCYSIENYNIKNLRYACIAKKNKVDKPKVYYKKQIIESEYFIGGST